MKKNLILVLNCGSSSLKFSLIKPENGQTLLSGLAERLLSEQASIKIKYQGKYTFETNRGEEPIETMRNNRKIILDLNNSLNVK